MECAEHAALQDLSYCQGTGAIIHIGELETAIAPPLDQDIDIKFTDLATGHVLVLPVEAANLPSLVIDSTLFTPVPGHTYMIEAVYSRAGGGITPQRLRPYIMSAGVASLAANAYDFLTARFVKVFNATATVEAATEQWLTIPS